MMEDLIRKQNKVLITATIIFVALFIIFWFVSASSDNFFLYFFLIAWVFCIIYTVRELAFFNYNFGNIRRHLINWEYPNGDKLIITCWGLMKQNTSVPKLSFSSKFEGFKWDLDNAKDLAECLIKSEGNPLMSLLPSIGFSTTSNHIDDYIPFSFRDKINLTFIDKDRGYLIIHIEKKNTDTKYTLTYPLPPSKKSLEAEADNFEDRINNRWTPVRALYLDKSLVEEISNEK